MSTLDSGARMKGVQPLRDKSVLIVEDEPMIALEIHAALRDAGASIIAATTGAEAFELIRSADIAAAVLDVNLGDRDCAPACAALSRRRIPFVFYTGHTDAPVLHDWPSAPVVRKPASPAAVISALLPLIA